MHFRGSFGGEHAASANRKGLKDAIAWLKQAGLPVVFPAGEVSHLNLKERAVTDPEWSHSVGRLIRITGASALPMCFRGTNSALFQLLGCLNPRVRTALLASQFFNKHNRNIELRIGTPIAPAKIREIQDDVALIRYLRGTYLLESREDQPGLGRGAWPATGRVMTELLATEVARLEPERTLVQNEDFSVLLAKANEIPNVLHEMRRRARLPSGKRAKATASRSPGPF